MQSAQLKTRVEDSYCFQVSFPLPHNLSSQMNRSNRCPSHSGECTERRNNSNDRECDPHTGKCHISMSRYMSDINSVYDVIENVDQLCCNCRKRHAYNEFSKLLGPQFSSLLCSISTSSFLFFSDIPATKIFGQINTDISGASEISVLSVTVFYYNNLFHAIQFFRYILFTFHISLLDFFAFPRLYGSVFLLLSFT